MADADDRASTQRFGDLLPLPLPPSVCGGLPIEYLTRTGRRRRLRRLSFERHVAESVFALNTLAGHSQDTWPTHPLNEAQRSSLRLILTA